MRNEASGRLIVSRLIVRGVLGIEEHTIDLGAITVLEGSNASGKTSHMAALRAGLGIDRTSLARIAHIGPDGHAIEPEVEVILIGTDEDREVRVRRRGDSSPEVRERIGEAWRIVPRPVEWLHQLIDVQGANPAALLTLKADELVGAILEAMRLEHYDRAEALRQAGLEGFSLPPLPEGLHPLEDLELIERAVTDARRAVGAEEQREKDASTKLLAGLPAEALPPVVADLARAEEVLSALQGEAMRSEAEAEEQERGGVHSARLQLEAEIRELEAAMAERLAEQKARLQLELAASIQQAQERCQASINAALEAASGLRAEAKSKADLVADARVTMAQLQAQAIRAESDRHVRATAHEAKAKAERLSAQWDALSVSLEALKTYKVRLASRLPIKGLAVCFDEKGKKSLLLDGVPLDQVNRARLAEVAVEVALLRASVPKGNRAHLPLIFLDDAEKLDPDSRRALLLEVAQRGTQVVAAVVSTKALEVLRDEAAIA